MHCRRKRSCWIAWHVLSRIDTVAPWSRRVLCETLEVVLGKEEVNNWVQEIKGIKHEHITTTLSQATLDTTDLWYFYGLPIYSKASVEVMLLDWPTVITLKLLSQQVLHPLSFRPLYQIQLLIMNAKTQLSRIALSVNLCPCLPG